MDFLTMAASVTQHTPTAEFHPVFQQRATAVAELHPRASLGSTVHIGPVRPPERLAPARLFHQECHTHDLPEHDVEASQHALAHAHLAELRAHLDTYAQFTGDVHVPAAVVVERSAEIHATHNHRLLALSAALTTYSAHTSAPNFWEAAALSARTAVELVRARLNLAATYAFVFHDPTTAVDHLDHLDDMVRDAHDDAAIDEGDFAVFRGLISHLRALTPGVCTHAHAQVHQLRVSCALATLKNLRAMGTSFAAYHSAQQHLTLGSTLLHLGHLDKGIELLQRNVDYCLRHTRRALPDVHVALAEGYLLNAQADHAADVLDAARATFIRRGELHRAEGAETLPDSLPHLETVPARSRHLAVAQ